MKSEGKVKGWKDVPRGGLILDAGNALDYETGDWRTYRPVWHPDRCINCFLCWVYCPDSAIEVKDGKVVGIDYKHCKGCGICANECPPKVRAIQMLLESEAAGHEHDKAEEAKEGKGRGEA
ncbi:MAG: 4Fe-4S binding protein [Firmicutes bacterium]|nr:4Fe-4S binding protein [Bacillota bacterium]